MSNLKEQSIEIQQKLRSLTIEVDRLIEKIPSAERAELESSIGAIIRAELANLQSLTQKVVRAELAELQSSIRKIVREELSKILALNQQSNDPRSIDKIDLENVIQPVNSVTQTSPQRSQNVVLYGSGDNPPIGASNPDRALQKALDRLIDIYHNNPEDFFKTYQPIPVKESQASIEKRRGNSGIMPVLSKTERQNYWIVPDKERGYVFPDPNLVVNPYNLDTVDALFKNTDYHSSYKKIHIIDPSIAAVQKLADGEEWIVVQKGSLIFM
jgi:hypothetical protein